jgi:hypothetical protein
VIRSASFALAGAAAVAAVAVLAPARAAHALSCAEARQFLAPGDGSILPPDPVVYLFSPFEPTRPRVTVRGAPVEATIEQIGANRSYRVYAIRIPAPDGDVEAVVELGPGFAARYQIDARWQRPGDDPGWLEASRREWAGGFGVAQSHIALRSEIPAPAFRVSVGATSEADELTVVVPGLGRGGRSVHFDPLDACEGVFAPAEPGEYARVAALFSDGGESQTSGPVLLTAPGWSDRARVLALLFALVFLVAGLLFAPGDGRARAGGH